MLWRAVLGLAESRRDQSKASACRVLAQASYVKVSASFGMLRRRPCHSTCNVFLRPDSEKWQKRLVVLKDGYLLYYSDKKHLTDSFDTKVKVRLHHRTSVVCLHSSVLWLGRYSTGRMQRVACLQGSQGIHLWHQGGPPRFRVWQVPHSQCLLRRGQGGMD